MKNLSLIILLSGMFLLLDINFGRADEDDEVLDSTYQTSPGGEAKSSRPSSAPSVEKQKTEEKSEVDSDASEATDASQPIKPKDIEEESSVPETPAPEPRSKRRGKLRGVKTACAIFDKVDDGKKIGALKIGGRLWTETAGDGWVKVNMTSKVGFAKLECFRDR